jgi:polysaccharide deacetylase family protein (PEP-CTERM system associated)
VKTPENVLTIDVEDWYHILDSPVVPNMGSWGSMESRVEQNMLRILELLERSGVKATFFWLGWMAERHRSLVLMCRKAGHEIASHGYAHVLPYKIGPNSFREDANRAKVILEDIVGETVLGYRAPGFGITNETRWAFEIIKELGYSYDSSVFPGVRGHGGIPGASLEPYIIKTNSGFLLECPIPAVKVFGRRLFLFGGGYLRLAPRFLIYWGFNKLHSKGQSVIIYIHPREIDPEHPRLPLSMIRRFKSYVNIRGTLPKLEWMCERYTFGTMREFASRWWKRSRDLDKS